MTLRMILGFAVRRMLLVNLFFLSAYILFYVFCIVTAVLKAESKVRYSQRY